MPFLFLFLIVPILLASNELPILKEREPHFEAQTLKTYASGSPHIIRYFDQNEAVKELEFSLEGHLIRESDLKDDTLHGPSLFYTESRTIDSLCYYDMGVLNGPFRSFYPGGRIKSVYTYKDGKRNGVYILYFEGGEIQETGSYVDAKRAGSCERFYENQTLSMKCSYVNGLLSGEYMEWSFDGSIKIRAHYFKGLLHGNRNQPAFIEYYPNQKVKESSDYRYGIPIKTHTRFHPDGSIAHSIPFLEGKKHGNEQSFSEDGTPLSSGEYSKGIPCGVHKRYDSNGNLALIAEYKFDGDLVKAAQEFDSEGRKRLEYTLKNDLYHGSYLEWHPNGNLKQRLYFNEDKLEGLQEAFSSSGLLITRAHFSNGIKSGPYSEWHPNGQLKVQAYFKNGNLDGDYIEWFENGIKKRQYAFINGDQAKAKLEWTESGQLLLESSDSALKEWHPNGQLKTCHLYNKAGRLDGLSESFAPDGTCLERCLYLDGKLDSESFFYYGEPPYHLEKKLNHQDGKLHGQQLRFFKNGNVESILTYKNGILDGEKKLFDSDGTLLEEASYCNGHLEGPYYLKRQNGMETFSHYKDNKLEGLYQVYYPFNKTAGHVKALESNYSNGLLDGEFAQFNESGTKILEALYVGGLREGFFTLFSPKGQVIFAAEFKNDMQEGRTLEYYPSGTVFKEAYFVNDLKTGDERTFFENGALKAITPFQEGLPSGMSKEWNQAGTLIYEVELKNGKVNGRLAKYDDSGALILEKEIFEDTL